MTPVALHRALKRVNRMVGLGCGLVLVGTGILVLVEIVMRRVAFGLLGGTDEICGYVMAGLASWAAACALIERAHIRIDLMHRRLPVVGRTLLDMAGLAVLSTVAVMVVFYGWRVLAKSLASGSTANTPLETPLWIPQSVWLAGWLWFAFASLALLALTLWAALRRDWTTAAEIAGPEADEILAELEAGR